METLHPNVRLVWIGTSVLGAVVLGVLVAVVDEFLLGVGPWLAVVAFVIGIGWAIPYSVARYRLWRFEIQSDALYLHRGVFTRVETAVPYVRIQHVDTKRGPIARLVGLSSVVVYTAGSRGADVTIPGLEPERADGLHDQLRELAIESEDAV